jgi:hypothetical protein
MTMKRKFDQAIYCNIPYDDLLVYALYSVIEKKLDTTFENLVVECYELFPERFGLPGFINIYPDSAQVEKSWLRCRTDKSLITGNKAQGFHLTDRGYDLVQKVISRLGTKVSVNNNLNAIRGDRRTKNGRIVKQLEENPLFKDYLINEDNFTINEFEFCDLIYCTLDAFPETRRNNIKQLKDALRDYNREDMLKFIELCERKFAHLLFTGADNKSEFAGGMMKRRVNKS